jgi:sugar phosphate isomerase/epimerase
MNGGLKSVKKNQIAAQLYTLRDYTQTAEDLDRTLGRVAAIGYRAVQVSGIGPIEPARVKALADRHGLAICATHVPYARLKDDLEAVVAEHRLWNCRYAGLGMIPRHYYEAGCEGFEAFAKEMAGIAAKLHDAGLQFVYHNHKLEFERFGDSTGMDLLLRGTDPRTFHFELDTYWVQAGGGDPAAWIRKLDGRMKVVHLKDMAIVKDEQVFAELGEGNLNWDAILDACRAIGMEWYVVEQDVCRRDPFESLAISWRFLSARAED